MMLPNVEMMMMLMPQGWLLMYWKYPDSLGCGDAWKERRWEGKREGKSWI